jgi:hypothetical protein
LDRAKIAGAGADVAEDHHGGGAPGPALTQIGALRTLANRVELVFVDQFAHGLISRAGGQFGAKPLGFTGGVGEIHQSLKHSEWTRISPNNKRAVGWRSFITKRF